MRRVWLLIPFAALCFVLFSSFAATQPPGNNKNPNPPGEEVVGCVAPNEWFQSAGTKEASYTTDLNSDNDCDFYRFAWQSFLFATEVEKGGSDPRFLKFATPEEVFGSYASIAFPKRRDVNDLVLSPRMLKSKQGIDVTTVFQAVSDGVVVDQNGRAVYYGLHMNDAFVAFVKRNKLTKPDGIAKADKALMFEPGCLEFKSSWRIVGKGEDCSDFITKTARLPTLVTRENKIVVDPSTPRDEKVALVGLHVVGVAKGHPEFIWATFEHIRNAPDLPVDLINRDFQILPAGVSDVVADKPWTFCSEGAHAKDCNLLNKDKIKIVNESDQTLAPITQVFRYYSFGGDNPRGVASLNASVHEKLPAGDVRKNYEMIGAVWLDNPLDKDGKMGTFVENKSFSDNLLAGATKLSSSTMETFSQNLKDPLAVKNCFGCHDTQSVQVPNITPPIILDPKRINVSHMIQRAFSHGKQMEAAANK